MHQSLLRAAVAVLFLGLVVVATGAAVGDTDDRPSFGTTTTTAPPTTTTVPPGPFPPLPADGAAALRTPTGVVVPLLSAGPDGYIVLTPCADQVHALGEVIPGAHVVLDPGHGGSEPGAVGPSGLTEKDVNLDVARRARDLLEAEGAAVVLTRDDDLRVTLETRAKLAERLRPQVFVSIHHNAAPLTTGPRPGVEIYHQHDAPESRRFGGLLHEELQESFAAFTADWAVGDDPGVRSRRSSSGADFYGVLRRTAGVTAVLSEAAFISNPSEEALLATEAFRQAEAEAVADAIMRFVTTTEPGSGFAEPFVSDASAGGGGGRQGCVDPPLR